MKQTIEVDVPDGWRAAGYRCGRRGEKALSHGIVTTIHSDTAYELLIVEPDWHWPEWLTAPWIACDSDGVWCAFALEPSMRPDGYWESGRKSDLNLKLFAFLPPPCTDWRQSKRKNPRCGNE